MRTQQKTQRATARESAGMLDGFEQLDAVLRQLVAEHETLLGHTRSHKGAIMRADAAGLARAMAAQQGSAQRIAALERHRQTVVAGLPRVAGTGGTGARFVDVIGGAPEAIRSRLAGVVAALRELLSTLHAEHVALRAAAETLSMHMEGLMRQVCRGLSNTGTYARRGGEFGVQMVSSVDVRS